MMNSSEFESDPRLREGLRSLSIPRTPLELESRVRKRIRRQRLQRGVLASSAVVALGISLSVWTSWSTTPAPIVQNPQRSPTIARSGPPTRREIPQNDLAILFAPPPVERLSILDRQNKGFVTALNRLEDVK